MSPTAMSMPMKAMSSSTGDYWRSSFQIRCSGNEPKEPPPGAEMASMSPPLAAVFRRRLLVGTGTVSGLGANFLGSTSFLLGLEPELSRKLKLGAIYSIGGYTRCLEINNGFEFIYPAAGLGIKHCCPGKK